MRPPYREKEVNIALYLVAFYFDPRSSLPSHFYFGLES